MKKQLLYAVLFFTPFCKGALRSAEGSSNKAASGVSQAGTESWKPRTPADFIGLLQQGYSDYYRGSFGGHADEGALEQHLNSLAAKRQKTNAKKAKENKEAQLRKQQDGRQEQEVLAAHLRSLRRQLYLGLALRSTIEAARVLFSERNGNSQQYCGLILLESLVGLFACGLRMEGYIDTFITLSDKSLEGGKLKSYRTHMSSAITNIQAALAEINNI